MKRILWVMLLATLGLTTVALAQSNRAARVEYVLSNIGVDAQKQKALKPLLQKYLETKKYETKDYDDMKDDLKSRIDAGTLTDSQANSLMKAKWAADQKELDLKKQYEPKFKAVVGAAKTWYVFDLLNDKKSKVRGEKK